jgi:hypothetical protein
MTGRTGFAFMFCLIYAGRPGGGIHQFGFSGLFGIFAAGGWPGGPANLG